MAMIAVVAVMAVMQIAAASSAASAQKKAGEEARRISELNAANIEAETNEKVRRAEGDLERRMALGRAKAGAGGTLLEGTPQIFLNAVEDEGLREIDWTKRAGAGQLDVERYRGQSAVTIANANAQATMWQGYASAAQTVGSYGKM